MAILIKGMEMPKSCRNCPFRRETYLLTRQLCTVNNDEEICSGIDTVDKSCPLVSVPEHGRMIDADAFDERVRQAGGMCEEELTEDFKDGVQTVLVLLKDQPTIIPATAEGET